MILPWNFRILLIGIALLLVGTFGTLAQQWVDPTFLPSLPDTIMATLSPQFNQAEYLEKFQQADTAIQKSDWASAERLLKTIKFQSNPLQPVVLLQLAKAQAEQGQEGAAEYNLLLLANRYRLTTFSPIAKYQLAQSYLRSSQTNKAKVLFENIGEKYPQSQIALGCHYFLGQIALSEKHPELSAQLWKAYVLKSQDGRFSELAAEGLKKLKATLSSSESQAIAQIDINHEKWEAAQNDLKGLPARESWLLSAKTLLGLNKTSEALSALVNGLQYAKNQEEADEAIELIIKIAPNAQATLQALSSASLAFGKDTILWELAQRADKPETQLAIQKLLLAQFPQSNWAPETFWAVMRNDLKKANLPNFLSQANAYLQKYPNKKSAPKVLFWKGKILLRQNQPQNAASAFNQLVTQYPGNYFSYRAQQLLAGKSFPIQIKAMTALNIPTESKDDITAFMPFDGTAQSVLQGLIEANTPTTTENILTLLADIEGKKPHPYLLANIRSSAGDHYSAIKLVDKYVAEQSKAGKCAETIDTMPDLVKKLWYPLPYMDSINQWSQKRHLAPTFTAAIIRQESAYNPLAISRSKALGLMQLLPTTATEVAHTDGLNGFSIQSLFLPDTNIRLGTRYLQYLQQRFSGATIFMTGAYNGGPNAMAKWIAQSNATAPNADLDWFIEQIPYDQTREYIQQVYGHIFNYQSIYKQ